jgi:hypothetical protein
MADRVTHRTPHEERSSREYDYDERKRSVSSTDTEYIGRRESRSYGGGGGGGVGVAQGQGQYAPQGHALSAPSSSSWNERFLALDSALLKLADRQGEHEHTYTHTHSHTLTHTHAHTHTHTHTLKHTHTHARTQGYASIDEMARIIGNYNLIYQLDLPDRLVASILDACDDGSGYVHVRQFIDKLVASLA